MRVPPPPRLLSLFFYLYIFIFLIFSYFLINAPKMPNKFLVCENLLCNKCDSGIRDERKSSYISTSFNYGHLEVFNEKSVRSGNPHNTHLNRKHNSNKTLPWLGAGQLHTWRVSWHFPETTCLLGLDSWTWKNTDKNGLFKNTSFSQNYLKCSKSISSSFSSYS